MLFLVLFHTNILLYLHFCSRKHCHPFLYSLNSYFFNLFLIFICALTFFCNELLFSVEADGCYPQSQEFLDNLSPIILLGFVCVQKPKLLDSIQRKRWFHWYFRVIASPFFRIHALRQFFSCVQSLWLEVFDILYLWLNIFFDQVLIYLVRY